MPYNNTPIAPSKEVTGHVSLPLARVQKIIHADPERLNVTKNAAFAIALATEMFIQHLATTTHNVVKAERKPRRNIQYRDVSSAVAKTDNLEFAVDVVPKTATWREVKRRREQAVEDADGDEPGAESGGKDAEAATNGHGGVANGNGHGNGNAHAAPGAHQQEQGRNTPGSGPAKPDADEAPDKMHLDERVDDDSEHEEEDAAARQLEMEMRGPPRPKTASPDAKSHAHVPVPAPVPVPVPAPTGTTRRSTGGFTAINGAK
ncbi:hypothetical protein ACEQ8H_005627 [Pleosporales sp. CAS-2024a]